MNVRFATAVALAFFSLSGSYAQIPKSLSAGPAWPVQVWITTLPVHERSEGVRVTVGITNTRLDPILVNSRLLVNDQRLPGEVYFAIHDDKGNILPQNCLITARDLKNSDFQVLHYGESVQRSFEIDQCYPFGKKGSYQLQAVYRNNTYQNQSGMEAWMGETVSEAVDIELR